MSHGQKAPPVTSPQVTNGAGLDRRALVAASVTVVAWASAFVAIRDAGRYFDPGALALGRLLAGSAVLAVVWLTRDGRLGEPFISRAETPWEEKAFLLSKEEVIVWKQFSRHSMS